MKKHSVEINGRQTSVSVEAEFWDAIKQIASERKQTISQLISSIAQLPNRKANLSSEVRVQALQWSRERGRIFPQ